MWEMADVHKIAVRRGGSKNEGSEPRVELVYKHGVKVSPVPSGNPQHQIPLPEDIAIPLGSTPNGSRSALPKPFEMNQMSEMMKQMMEQMEGNIQKQNEWKYANIEG